ncbi:uncharacterized protein [Glycine max]|uniref:uncharacterized protein isoform X1 n=1 Tax=Glycine max TaxID=3847 RepID=UPI001B355AC9|nr:uncharacterized protein LOC100805217 isoform X1 [Glycine max]XP_040868453.1 uncharacterized protein LOC100805217 isoform X1 [Glycine max]
MPQTKRCTNAITLKVVMFVSKDVTFHETESFFTSPSLQGESSLEAEIPELSCFLLLQDSTPMEDDKDPKPASSPVQHKEDKRFGNQYQRRKKSDLVQQQLQSSEPELRTHTLEDTLDASCESNLDDLLIALRKGKRSCAKYPISQFVSTKNLSLQHQSFISAIDSIRIPTSVQEALKDENWVRAVNEEMGALERNEIWEIVERPKDQKTTGCRWIYTVKYQVDGTLDRYKVRLVAKGYTQTYGINYEEAFALSPRAWFDRFTQAMVSLGYKLSQGDHTLFIKHSQDDKLTLLLVYVDDIIIAGDDELEKQTLRERLVAQFEMKDLRKLKYFLEIEVAYSRQGIFISQRKYILYLLKEVGELGCKTTGAPIEQNHWIENDEENSKIEKTQY